jgi:hypothetical protein
LCGVIAGAEAVVEGLVADASVFQRALGPLMAVQVDPDRKGSIGIGLDESGPEVRAHR